MKIHLIKKGYYLTPVDAESLELVKKLSKDVLKCEVKVARNYEFHKKFFALIKLGHENSKLDMPFDSFRKYIILKAGYFKAYTTPKGTYFEPDSISFSSMSETKFQDLYKDVLQEIANLLDLTNQEILDQLINF